MPAIRVKSLSKVKSVAPCSEAIAAIRASAVVTATPFARAARKILAASRYVGKPFGSNNSHCERYFSMRFTSRLRPCRISVTIIPVSPKGSASEIMRCNSPPAGDGDELRKSIQTEVSTRIKSGFSGGSWECPAKCRCRSIAKCPFGFLSGQAVPRLYRQSAASF